MNLDPVCVHGIHVAQTQCKACLNERVIELETKLGAWENAAQVGHPTPCTLGPLCPYCEIDRLQSRLDRYENLLRECLSDYGNPYFTDRYGMADRLRVVLTRDVEKPLPLRGDEPIGPAKNPPDSQWGKDAHSAADKAIRDSKDRNSKWLRDSESQEQRRQCPLCGGRGCQVFGTKTEKCMICQCPLPQIDSDTIRNLGRQ